VRRVERIGRAGAADAEYRALALGLDLAAAHGADPIEVRSDSQLAIAALTGTGDERFSEVRWTWHPRAENEIADARVRAELWGDAHLPSVQTVAPPCPHSPCLESPSSPPERPTDATSS
jgi:hypothetical protein